MRRQRGGDSAAYTFGAAVSAGAPYASSVIPTSACMATPRPGELVNYSAGSGGLPGFQRGGSRRRRQRGGRYSIDLTGPTTQGTNVFAPVSRGSCEGGTIDTRPQVVHRGGAAPLSGSDSAFYSAPTAGYGNTASTWVSSTGTPSLIQTPYDARSMNPACLKTGGGSRRRRRRRQGKSRRRSY
jgi:hypothetical protein